MFASIFFGMGAATVLSLLLVIVTYFCGRRLLQRFFDRLLHRAPLSEADIMAVSQTAVRGFEGQVKHLIARFAEALCVEPESSRLRASAGALADIAAMIEGIDYAQIQLPASEASKLKPCRERLEAVLETQVLLCKQLEDLNSYVIRTDLHLSSLNRARRGTDAAKLKATLAMVQSFAESAQLFKAKWANQVKNILERFPVLQGDLPTVIFARLENMPDGLAGAEKALAEALDV